MKILLIGEYSNVHWTLAEGLRILGHEVTVLSDGDGWKNYQRDINLQRRSLGKLETLRYLADVELTISRLKDFDVVQIINPIFLDLKAERIMRYYRKLRRQNKKMFLGAFGIDRLWVSEGLKPDTFKYSDFYLNGQLRDYPFLQEMKRHRENEYSGPEPPGRGFIIVVVDLQHKELPVCYAALKLCPA